MRGDAGGGTPLAPSLLIRLDDTDRGALQQQIYEGIRRAILDGVLPPGTRLPSSRALAADLRVSRTTTVLAFDQLLAEGYLSSQAGSGTYVARELPDDLPQVDAALAGAPGIHPPLSRRGDARSTTPTSARRIVGPPRAFRIGTPAVDLVPLRLWAKLMNQRLRTVTLSQLDYGDARGVAPLREAIAAHVQGARATRCTPDQILIVAGAQRGIELICQMLLDPGDEAWLEEPGYPGARSALLGASARIVPVAVDGDGLDVAAGIRRAPAARLAYVSPSHQFPLGVPMTLARRLALLKWASRARAWIVEDDYDSEFRYSARPLPCLHGLDADGRVIYVGSFAKTLFPGLRLGFLIVPPDLVELLRNARRASDLHPPVIDQLVLADFMASGHYERHVRRMRAVYRERAEALGAAAVRYCGGGLVLRPVRTGLHAVADVDPRATPERVFDEASRRGIEVMPVSSYFIEPAPPTRALVLGFGSVAPDVIDRGMQQLAEALDAAIRLGVGP